MDMESSEIRDFLAQHPPFSQLDAEARDTLACRMTLHRLHRGSAFPPPDAAQPSLYLLRNGAVEQRDAAGALIAELRAGDLFDTLCYAAAAAARGVVVANSLFYLLPCSELQALRQQHPRFDEYFRSREGRGLRLARDRATTANEARLSLMCQPVTEFASRSPVTAPSSMTIRDAARLMTRERVSALLIVEGGQLAGIVTDRDLRSRGLAADVDAGTAVAAIMTRKLQHIAPDATAFEALLDMTRAGVHHLPIVDADGVRGLVSATDLTRWLSANPVYLAGTVRRCDTRGALVRASTQLPALLVHLVADGATASQIGQALASVGDAFVCRLVELAQQCLGPAPLPFAWLSGGSQGRHEQALHSDQDSALILHDAYREDTHGAWFEEFARFVGDGLNACGYRYCPGAVMAANPEWRRPLAGWIDTARGWIRNCDRKSSMLAANLIDMRGVCGDPALWPALQRELLHEAGRQQAFLAHMAANALTNRPPLGLFRKLVLIAEGEHARTLDIKHQGLIPISDMARIHALAIGASALGTVARLHAAAQSAELSARGAAELAEAFEYLGGLRLHHQAQQVRRGQPPDNYLAPDGLSAPERKRLKAAFGVIATLQAALAQRYPQCIER